MEIRVLKYFVESAKHRSMTKAAEKLHITQPTLSRQLKDLEDELGQKLFTRTNYNIKLTPEGEILYKRASDILDMVDKTILEFNAMKDFNGGDIHIGCAESYGISILAKSTKNLQIKYPNIRYHLYSGNFESVTQKLDRGLLDFAIVVQNMDTSKYNYIDLPYEDTWGLIVRKDSPLAKKTEITIKEIIKLPLIISRQGFSNEMPNSIRSKKDELNIVATYDLLYNASIFVKEGIGYALSFDKLIDTSIDSELCFVPIAPAIFSPMKIIWSNNQILSRASKLLLNELNRELS